MLSYGVGKVLPCPTVDAKCSYPTRVDVVYSGIDDNRANDVEPNEGPPVEDSLRHLLRTKP